MRLCWFSICFVECIFLFFFRYCIWIKTNKFPLEWGWNALNNRWSRWNHQTNKIRLDLEVGLGQLSPSLLCGSYNREGNYEDIQKPALCEHLYSLGPSSVLLMIGWNEYDLKASQVLVCVLYRRFGPCPAFIGMWCLHMTTCSTCLWWASPWTAWPLFYLPSSLEICLSLKLKILQHMFHTSNLCILHKRKSPCHK